MGWRSRSSINQCSDNKKVSESDYFIWVRLRKFSAPQTPTNENIYTAKICVIVWVNLVFPWLLEGLTGAWVLLRPTSGVSGSWIQQEKLFCWINPPPLFFEDGPEPFGGSCWFCFVCQIVFKVTWQKRKSATRKLTAEIILQLLLIGLSLN